MAIQDLLKYVDGLTAEQCEKLLSEAGLAASASASAAESEKKKYKKEHDRKLDAARRAAEEHHLRLARMTARRASLSERREILDGLYGGLFKKIASSDEIKTALYEKLASGIEQSPKAELVVSASEPGIWSSLKKKIRHAKISEGGFTGGFIYKTAESSWNFTLDNLFEDFRAKTQSEAAALLFGNLPAD